jgi:hypothetical protein
MEAMKLPLLAFVGGVRSFKPGASGPRRSG